MRSIVFCKRTIKEILRDPLSYIFCLGFPIVMLVIMTIVNSSIPKQAGLDIFKMNKLGPGMAFFGLSFIMIFTAIQVSTDRSTSLITRLHASPMTSVDFIIGYTLPVFVIAVLQVVITYIAAFIIGAVSDASLPVGYTCVSVLTLIPSMLLFIAFGLFFGTILNEKSAPGVCSIVVTVTGMLGGVWMPVDTMGGNILDISRAMPFYHGVQAARYTVAGELASVGKPLVITLVWALALYVVAVIIMDRKLKSDIR